MQTVSRDVTDDGVEIDLREDVVVSDAAEVERWVSVAEASELSGIRGSKIRQWYRSGRVPTQRADGDRGGFLVPLADILRLAEEADDAGDDLGDPVLDLNASYWSLETAAAREETAAVRAELADATRQLAFLRDQLVESSAAERAAAKRADDLEAELTVLRRISRATSSITDTSWLELATNRYESPVRGQGSAAPVDREDLVADDLDAHQPALGGAGAVDGHEPPLEHPRPGEHADDLLPSVSEKRSRRNRR